MYSKGRLIIVTKLIRVCQNRQQSANVLLVNVASTPIMNLKFVLTVKTINMHRGRNDGQPW